MTSKKKPVGARIRDIINPALEDSRRMQIQLDLLSEYFTVLTLQFPKMLEDSATDFFNKVASKKTEEKNPYVIRAITKLIPSMMGSKPEYSPIIRMEIPVVSAFCDFSALDIKELPAYVLLHEALRAHDVSIKIIGLTADESRGLSGLMPPLLIIDGSKSYEQGAMENSNIYPDLPDLPEEFDAETPRTFKFKQRPGQG